MHVHYTATSKLFIRRHLINKFDLLLAIYIDALENYFIRDDNISRRIFPDYMIYNMSWFSG